jgi:hypothetical protein
MIDMNLECVLELSELDMEPGLIHHRFREENTIYSIMMMGMEEIH